MGTSKQRSKQMNKLLLDELKIMYSGMAQVSIAALSGLTPATISKIWNSKQGLTISSFCQLCEALDDHNGLSSMTTAKAVWYAAALRKGSKI
jgi:transcriptional regulator with XRE-family HTH domain